MINIDDKTRRLSQATIVVGYKQENKAESIEFKIPDYLKEYGKKICFKTKDGKVFSKLFDNTTSNIFTFTRTETQYGELDATIQFFKTQNEDMIVYKTSMLHIIFNETINCEDEVQPDEPKIPILESLIEKVTDLNETITENEETRNNNENIRISNENIRIANETQRDIYYTGIQNKVNNGEFNGATYLPNVDAEGNITWTNDKGLENPSVQNIRGPQGIQGPQGEAFKIKKTYSSIEAMQNDFDNMEVGDYAMIATSIELEDNAKLYARTETEWIFITDFSGATGIQGPQGIQGIQGAQGERGIGISKLEVKQGYLYVTLTDNSTQNAGLIITDEVKQWLVTEITNNAESTFNQYYDTKVSEFNENVQAKLDEYNANAEALANKVVELETENTSLKNQIPSGEEVGNPIHLSDSSDMECEIVPIGNAEQETREGYNKLIYPYENTTKTTNGITFTDNGDGTITANGTATSKAYFNLSRPTLKPGSYTVSIEPADSANVSPFKYFFKFGSVNVTSSYKFEFTESFTPKESYLCINDGVTVNNLTFKPMLVEGNNVLPYQPYGAMPSPDYPSPIQTVGQNGSVEISVDNGLETTDTNYQSYTKVLPIQKEFVKIGDVEDTFVKVDGKWYEKHNIKKLTLDGTESWNWHSDGFGFTKAAGISIVPNDKVLAISNFLLGIQIGSNGTYYKDKDNVIFSWMSGNLICLKATNKFTDVETLKSWLAEQYANGTPVTVYYVLTTSELLECTEEQEEILNSFYTYKGITNVSMSGIGKIKIIYKKDLETMFNNIIKQIPNSTSDTTET